MNNEPVNLKPYLKNSVLHKTADVLYRNVIEPVLNLFAHIKDRLFNVRFKDPK